MEQPRMGTLPDKKYPQVVTRQEVAFLVMGYLKEEKFKQTLEIFEKEAKSVIKNMKLVSTIIITTIFINDANPFRVNKNSKIILFFLLGEQKSEESPLDFEWVYILENWGEKENEFYQYFWARSKY